MISLSIIIPSRSPEFLERTVNDLLVKAEGEIEIIIIFDGIWMNPMPVWDKRVRLIHHGSQHNSYGMRNSINKGVLLSKGEYLMKTDEHCSFGQGFDRILIEESHDDWLQVPRRYRLDPVEWKIIEDNRPPVDYMTIDYPYKRPFDKTQGLHGSEDRKSHYDKQNILVDDLMTMQGSCWFLPRKLWDSVIKEMDDTNYGPFTHEAQELCNKVWLSGGACKVNKKTWYAHWHKGKNGKGYGFSNHQYDQHMYGTEKGRLFAIDYWLHTKDYKHDWDWFMKKFWPVPTWPENWKEQIELDKPMAYVGINQAGERIT